MFGGANINFRVQVVWHSGGIALRGHGCGSFYGWLGLCCYCIPNGIGVLCVIRKRLLKLPPSCECDRPDPSQISLMTSGHAFGEVCNVSMKVLLKLFPSTVFLNLPLKGLLIV